MFDHVDSNVDSDQNTSSSDASATVNKDGTATSTNILQQSTILSTQHTRAHMHCSNIDIISR